MGEEFQDHDDEEEDVKEYDGVKDRHEKGEEEEMKKEDKEEEDN